MGKLLIRKSGRIDLKLGDTLFEVESGMEYTTSQEVAILSKTSRQYSVLGPLKHRLMISPSVHSLLAMAAAQR
eukprot:g3381.t1